MSKIKEEVKILYKDYIKIILDYQIKSRIKYLKNFSTLFKKIDKDNNGILYEDEFVELISELGYYVNLSEATNRLLNIADPFNNKQITFSECISLFSYEIIEQNDGKGGSKKISLLDKISFDEKIFTI